MPATYNLAGENKSRPPLHVVLYTLIPADRAYRATPRGPVAFARNRVRRILDLLAWKREKRWRTHYSTFKDRANTNRGDIAIRMSVRCQIEHAFNGHAITITELPWGDLGMAAKLSPAPDLVVIAGGGFLFADRDGRLPARFAEDVQALERLSCPVAACAIGVNWLIDGSEARTFAFHPDDFSLIRRFLSRLALASVRDETTQCALAAVDRRPVQVVIDPGFLLADPAASPRIADPTQPLEIGLNIAFHGTPTSVTSRRMLPLMLSICKRLQAERSCRFSYFVHSDAEAAIASALKIGGLRLNVVNADVHDMLAAYRKMDIHVGQMLHSAILAMSVGTPALSLAYDVKSAGFYKLLGLDELCLDAAAVGGDQILDAIKALIENRHAVSAALIARRAALEAQSRAFYAAVASLVLSPKAGRPALLHGTSDSHAERMRTLA